MALPSVRTEHLSMDIYIKIPELLHEMLQQMIQEKNCDTSEKAHVMLEKLKEPNLDFARPFMVYVKQADSGT